MLAELTTLGWIFMSLSIAAVTSLVIWCYSRILRQKPPDEPELPAGLGP